LWSNDFIENPAPHAEVVADCVACRELLLSGQEENDFSGYLVLGLFRGQSRRRRLATFAFCFDLQYTVDLLDIRRQCDRYDKAHPLFTGAPKLFDRIRKRDSGAPDLELIDLNAVRSVGGSEIYQVDGGFAKLSPYLSPGIVNWACQKFPQSPMFVRLDPHRFYKDRPLQLLTEATLVPANPRWLPGFSLRKGMKEFAAYDLQDCSPRDAPRSFGIIASGTCGASKFGSSGGATTISL
jgi:hypothetical protein